MDRSLHRPCEQAATDSDDTAVLREDPVEIAPGVWWVGVRLAHDPCQCHTCFIAHGSDGVLIDPGSPLTIEDTMAKLRAITDLDAIRWLVCHHGDSGICAALPLAGERWQEFLLTPYPHFPGAMVSHDSGTRTLFSSDLFGAFVPCSSLLGKLPADASPSAWG
jgi:two-component system, cell cycle response regulator